MPVVVDREQVKKDILLAFERCMVTIPMANVSLRDIAKEAGMSHANLLNYFTSKDDLITLCCDVTEIWENPIACHGPVPYIPVGSLFVVLLTS